MVNQELIGSTERQFQGSGPALPLIARTKRVIQSFGADGLSQQVALPRLKSVLVFLPNGGHFGHVGKRQSIVFVHRDVVIIRVVVRELLIQVRQVIQCQGILFQVYTRDGAERFPRQAGERRHSHLSEQPVYGVRISQGGRCFNDLSDLARDRKSTRLNSSHVAI